MSRDLVSLGPLAFLDRAILLARRGGLRLWLPSLAGGALVAAVFLVLYHVERVEGVRSARPLFAFMLVLAWWARALLLARAARDTVKRAWERAELPDGAGRPLDVVRTASWVGLGLWVWLWLLLGVSLLGPFVVPLALPLLALRGAWAPSWLARTACTTDGGLRAIGRAIGDTNGRRASMITVEFLVLLGLNGLFLNLYLAVLGSLLVGRSVLGLDVAFIDSFLSLKNTFVLLVVASAAVILFEPLRVATSALAYIDARVRQEGLDLQLAVDEAVRVAEKRQGPRFGAVTRAAIVLGVVVGALVGAATLATPAAGQPMTDDIEFRPLPPGTGPDGVAPPVDPASGDPTGTAMPPKDPDALSYDRFDPPPASPADAEVRVEIAEVLDRPEFVEYEDNRGKSIREWIMRALEDLFSSADEIEAPQGPNLAIPLPTAEIFLVLGAVLLVLIVGYLAFTYFKDRTPASARAAAPTGDKQAEDPRDRAPEEHLDDASLLAREGDYRAALRALYLATLVSLDRRGFIRFDPTLTNWQYIRQMSPSATRRDFAQFTRLFDYKWYGDEPTLEADYRLCRSLADRLCRGEEREAA
jgi:hypothetical protein